MQNDPLAGIDQVEWAAVSHAYGEATDVPEYIRQLQSPDADTHQRALWHLYGNIFHQGSRYTATPLAIPFLYRLIDDPSTPNRGALLQFMAFLAFGYNPNEMPLGMAIGEKRKRVAELRQDPNCIQIIKKELHDFLADPFRGQEIVYWIGTELAGNLGSYIDSLRISGIPEDEADWWTPEVRSYNAVQNGINIAYQCLRDDSPEVRAGAAYLLTWFPDEFSKSEPHLLELLSPEETPGVQATAIIALATLQAMKQDFSETRVIRRLREIQSQSTSCLASWASSLALVKLRAYTEEQFSEVMKIFSDDEKYLQQMEVSENEFLFVDGRLSSLRSLAVNEIRAFKGSQNPEMVKVLVSIIESHSVSKMGVDIVELSSALLNMAFDGARPDSTPDFDSLNDLQKGVMRAINTRLTARFHNFGLGNVLESWKLPRYTKDFQVFIKHPDAFQSHL